MDGTFLGNAAKVIKVDRLTPIEFLLALVQEISFPTFLGFDRVVCWHFVFGLLVTKLGLHQGEFNGSDKAIELGIVRRSVLFEEVNHHL